MIIMSGGGRKDVEPSYACNQRRKQKQMFSKRSFKKWKRSFTTSDKVIIGIFATFWILYISHLIWVNIG